MRLTFKTILTLQVGGMRYFWDHLLNWDCKRFYVTLDKIDIDEFIE